MKNQKIRIKMLVGFGVIFLLIVALNGFSLVNLRGISRMTPEFYDGAHTQSLCSMTIVKELYRMDAAVKGMVLDGAASAEEYQDCRQTILTNLEALPGEYDSYKSGIRSALEELDARYAAVRPKAAAWQKEQALQEFSKAVSNAGASAQRLEDAVRGGAEQYLNRVDSAATRVIVIQDIIFVIAASFMIITALKLAADISRPVRKVAEGVGEIAQGRLNVKIPSYGRDEIGILALELNDTIANIKNYVYDISYVLGEIGGGNISMEVTGTYIGDFVQIKESLNLIIGRLNHTMRQISDCCEQVKGGARSLADNSERLAQGAAEQTSAMENFRESMGRVAQLTEQDAQNASEVRRISTEAAGCASDSDEKMIEMTSSMEEIERSSQGIAKVIKIIDDIAFQTNILALNAAVEAARAGEAGKGFAVVADEVRSLANKSQEAAQNTGEMIKKAIAAVSEGRTMVDASAESLRKVKDYVYEMAGRLEDIDKSTSEQASAFMFMNQSVDQITSVVQANASAAEENSAASEELSGQAEILEQLVASFQLK